MGIPKEDIARVSHINYMTHELHDDVNELYESIIDREKELCHNVITKMINNLKDLRESLDYEMK
jgi:hypothetical protein